MKRPVAPCILGVVLAILVAAPAWAIVDVSTPDNTTRPASDPGWDSVTSFGGVNYVYLGRSWVLAMGDTGGAPAQFSTGSFDPIPNQDFIVPNPASWSGLTAESDLRLIRINGDPGPAVRAAVPAAEPPAWGDEVVFIGQGRGRAADQTDWDVNEASDPWGWSLTQGEGNYHGYTTIGPVVKRWGANQIADEEEVFHEGDEDLNCIVTRDDRDVIALVTKFDQSGITHEAQAVAGDAGSAVFHGRDGRWELAGVVIEVSAELVFPGQTATWAVFGNHTALADISVYNDEIETVMSSHPEYSVMGDLNLDGDVWDGTGDPATDPDIAAFLGGWRAYDYGPGAAGDIASWQRGDLNLDGRTDVADFLLLRGALNPAASGALVSLLGTGALAVPEPSTAALVPFFAVLAVGGLRRRRRSTR